eukprot:TRINITY_DN29647_c0_g1_i1.p3 TRINITY_DN29647_c0_g1~~TRINITY_DN29647_c0_g1_i1.p3  ORF type:complete len:104 (+),score=0.44 TRINITY_DN29647_c0_g1_i1:222-533(+)
MDVKDLYFLQGWNIVEYNQICGFGCNSYDGQMKIHIDSLMLTFGFQCWSIFCRIYQYHIVVGISLLRTKLKQYERVYGIRRVERKVLLNQWKQVQDRIQRNYE